MKHINPKIARLLHEGLSMSTIEKMSQEQLNLLYKKLVSEQTPPPNEKKTVTATQTIVPPGGTATAPSNSKIENKGGKTYITTTTESELGEEEEKEIKEKSVSKQQQKLMGLALSVKRGDTSKSKVSKKVKDMAKFMSEKDLKDFASTKHKGLPITKENDEDDDIKKLEESIMKLVEKHIHPEITKKDLLKSLNKR
jgi:hypothetical protein